MRINVFHTIAKKKRRVLLALILLVGFLRAHIANAGAGDWIWEEMKAAVAGILYGTILMPFAWLLAWAGKLVNYSLQPWPLVTSEFVTTGWTATRDLGNMLFILALLGVALDYILFNSVGIKRALPRLLLIALLVNFSLPIAGVALDFANVFTNFFIERSGGVKFTETLGARLGLAYVFQADSLENAGKMVSSAGEAIPGTPGGVTEGVLTDTIFAIIFLAGTLFVFLALAILFFIRHLYLSALLIMLPLVLVASVLPFLSSHFKKWTSQFFQWTMFAPAASFFLYLAMIFLDSTQMKDLNVAMGGTGGGPFFETTGTKITTYVFAWMLMAMSLIVGQSMGIAGAGMAVSTFQKGTKWARGKAGNYAKRGVEKAGGAWALEKGQQLAAKAPIVGGFGARVLGGAAAVVRSAKREAAELTKGEKDLIETGSEKEVTSLIQGYAKGTADQRAKAAKMITLAERKNKLKIKDEKGNIDFAATRKMKIDLRAKAKAIGDIEAVKAIDRSDFSIAEQSINEKYNTYKKEGRVVDPDKPTESIESARHRKLAELYRKIDLGKEDWDDSVVNETFVKNALKYGALNAERFKQAQRSGNMALIDEFRALMEKTAKGEEKEAAKDFMAQENAVLRGWMKKSAAKDFIGNHDHVIRNLEQKQARPGSEKISSEEQKLQDEVGE